MEETGKFPDILAYQFAEAVSQLKQKELHLRVVRTGLPGEPVCGEGRVIRQRVVEEGKAIELTVAAED